MGQGMCLSARRWRSGFVQAEEPSLARRANNNLNTP
jgi:hypothetical protein